MLSFYRVENAYIWLQLLSKRFFQGPRPQTPLSSALWSLLDASGHPEHRSVLHYAFLLVFSVMGHQKEEGVKNGTRIHCLRGRCELLLKSLRSQQRLPETMTRLSPVLVGISSGHRKWPWAWPF